MICVVVWAPRAAPGSFWPALLIFPALLLLRDGWRLFGPAPTWTACSWSRPRARAAAAARHAATTARTAACRDERQRARRSAAEPALEGAVERASGGPERHHEKALEQGKLPVRERVALLLDEGSFSEEALLANWQEDGLGADGVVTGVGTIDGRPVALMANDPTVKAGSWGPKTVEKILRIQERALSLEVPMVYLVDSAGARITEQVQMFPGRRGAGRIFHNQVKLSGVVPQVCVLFGPSAAGGAYIPAFCDIVIMRDGNASMYLGSPRMAEMVIGEKVTLEEMGGARMHTGVSGCGHQLVKSDEEGMEVARRYLSYLPGNWRAQPPPAPAGASPAAGGDRRADPGRREQALRHQGADRRRCSTRARSSRSIRAGRRSWSSASPAWTARPSGSSPTSPSTRAACCSRTRRTRPHASSGTATPSTCRCCSSPTSPAS